MSAICDKKTKIKFDINEDSEWRNLQDVLSNGVGAFFICSHLGNIEALCAIPNAADKCMHAFMNMGQNPVFRGFIERHAHYTNTVIHPTEGIDIAMAGEMYDAIKRGNLIMMAGDRISPDNPDKIIKSKCLGVGCALPLGVFRFARACDCPVFAIANMNTGGEKYRVFVQKLDTDNIKVMANEYTKFLENLILQYPKQWFNFFDFFGC
jgi:predicted LPLAT superfamily acyltransferase